MNRYPFSFTSRVLNLFRRITRIPFIEKIIVQQNLNGNKITPRLTLTNKLYHKNTIRNCTRNGFNYRLDISDYMQHAIYFGLQNDTDFDREFLYSLIKKDDVVLDIGANIGETTLHFARLASEGKVFGFEPVPYVFDFFQNNVRLNNLQNIVLQNMALSNKEEILFFKDTPNKNSSGITLNKNKIDDGAKVTATSLDAIDAKNSFKKIDLIKLDVEGFEPFVFEGAKNCILKYKPKMYVEINHDHLQRNHFTGTDLLKIIQDLGYVLFKVKGKEIVPIENIHKIPKEVFELYAEPIV
jgi:FkbM family methyltransferase